MIDPGRPFSRPFQDLIESLEERIREGVEQPATFEAVFNNAVATYALPTNLFALTRVTGLVSGRFTVFTENTDYRLAGNQLTWRKLADGAADVLTPQPGTRFQVEYTFRGRPAGLTDFNPGSVIGTLVRAVAHEITLLYNQMDEAYRRAFIDQASGVALDNVVALLGVVRNPALKARGRVQFNLRRAPRDTVSVPKGTRVTDQAGRAFVTTEEGRILAVADPAQAPVEIVPQSGGQLKVGERIAQLVAVWKESDNEPTAGNTFPTQLISAQQPFGADERTIRLQNSALPDARVRVRYVPKSVTVAVEAVAPGPEGNAAANAIVVMPTPPPGVAGVINEEPLTGGQSAEADGLLRERAKHALERSGNATLNAIKFAVLDVDDVEGVEVLDLSVDETIPLGEVQVRYAGGTADKVRQVVDDTRAAGIRARLQTIDSILISGTFYVLPDTTPAPDSESRLRAAVLQAIGALQVGDPLSIRRLDALVYDIPGLADVAEAQLQSQRRTPAGLEPTKNDITTDPFTVARTEAIKADEGSLFVKRVVALHVIGPSRTAGGDYQIDLQLVDSTGAAITFRNFTLNIGVVLRARSLRVEGQTERIGNLNKTLTFTGAALVTLTITQAEATAGFRPADHEPTVDVLITPTAYPGLNSDDAKTTITVP